MGIDLSGTRRWLMILNVMGLCLTVILTAAIYLMFQNIIDNKNIDHSQQSLIGWIIIAYSLISGASIYLQLVIIKFIKSSTDEEFIANKYIIALFSLGIGGLCTPFMLTRMPNVNAVSTNSPRYTLSKHYGMAALIGGLLGIVFAAAFATKYNVIDFNDNGSLPMIVTGIFAASIVWGLLSIVLFWNKNSKKIFEEKTGIVYNIMSIMAFINLIVGTVILIFLMVKALINLINTLERLMQSNNGFDMFLNLINLMFMIWYVTFIIAIAAATIKGIWSKEDKVSYKVYTKLEEAKSQNQRA